MIAAISSAVGERIVENSMSGGHDQTCIACSSPGVEVFVEIRDVPVLCSMPAETQAEALGVPRGDIRLGYCRVCSHIYNLAYQPELLAFGKEYQAPLHFSQVYQQDLHALAADLIERYDLKHKRIVEIGSGQGDFLRLLCAGGINTGIGFDPSYTPSPGDTFSKGWLEFIRDYYSEQYVVTKVDFICSRHVLDHIEQPRAFLKMVRSSIGTGKRSAVFFEVPNVIFTLRDLSVWDIIFEHRSYFSPASLARLFNETGFEACRLSEAYGGQFLRIEANPNCSGGAVDLDDAASLEQMEAWVRTFADSYAEKVGTWRSMISQAHQAGRKTAVWGAGAKGVAFLNALGPDSPVELVVDINPRIWGKYAPGTGQQIIPPDSLAEHRPDIIVTVNPIYNQEIKDILNNLGLTPELLTA